MRAVPLHERTEVSGARASASFQGAQEQVPDSLAPAQREPAPALMLSPIVQHVAPLAERLQVSRAVLARVMVAVGAGQVLSAFIPGQGRGQFELGQPAAAKVGLARIATPRPRHPTTAHLRDDRPSGRGVARSPRTALAHGESG